MACTSGRIMGEFDDPIHQQFSEEEKKKIVEEVKRSSFSIAAHAHGDVGITLQ